MAAIGQLTQRLRYLTKLLVTTPHYGVITVLQIVSGLASFLGLPLLIPVLELMQGGTVTSAGYVRFMDPVLRALGLTVNFNTMLLFAAVLILSAQILVNISSLVASYVKEDMLRDYRKRIFHAYALADWQWLSEHHSAQMYYTVVREVEQACDAHMNAQRVFINFFQVAVLVAIALRLSWAITLLAVGIYFSLGILNGLNLNVINKLSEIINRNFKAFSNDIVSFQHNKKFIKVALLGERFINAFFKDIDVMCRLRKRQMLHFELQRAWGVLSMSVLLITLIYFHKVLALNYATLLLILFVFMRLGPQFVALSDIMSALEANIPMHKSLLLHLKQLEEHREHNGSRVFVPQSPLRFEHVQFAYPHQPLLFGDLNVTIEPHTMIALVGKSGCGKSTILDLLLGLLSPVGGGIYYGDIPAQELDKTSFRRHVAFVGQRPSLLDGSLRQNLVVAKPAATDAEIWDVCRKVYLKEFIEGLPLGLESVVGENGIKLSGGQRQRIALARCLLVDPEILILDEATSELDVESEAVIQNTLKGLKNRMTTIVVAHRLSTVKGADKIYVIEDGTACESGTYDDLLARGGMFSKLVSRQL